ncbi:hypothetical protein P608_23410 [Comamonas thiooxydans]|uniref:Uncharacterized protein n=1 Tax=Comamonas thiooxydans TaxID=363952 RepID=A0A0E3CBQ1_9BURK|nr:hypothetical protein P608_23410 [Comamonas thiooxydans]KGH10315.1 hypothetical protein P607_26515 [Comamonas thiooxydans]KGH18558.1 hypothetical protein P606_24840 [Comamonas thiooxydans]
MAAGFSGQVRNAASKKLHLKLEFATYFDLFKDDKLTNKQ